MPLEKNPGLQPIVVGEELCRIAGKVVMNLVKDDETKAVENLQLCGGKDAGCETAVHSMYDIFGTNETEAVLLVDVESAFNPIIRLVFLVNIKHIGPLIATFERNCYNVPARLFVLGGNELLPHGGTTQGDLKAMAIYGIALRPLLKHLATCFPEIYPKMVAFTDDLTSAGKSPKLCSWWKIRLDVGPKYGYFPKPSKAILIFKPKCE